MTRKKAELLKQLGAAKEEEADQGKLVEKLRKAIDGELRFDYLVTGGWSLKASQEAARLLGPEHVNVAADARSMNDGKFGNPRGKHMETIERRCVCVLL